MYFLPEKRILKIIKTFLKKFKKSVDKFARCVIIRMLVERTQNKRNRQAHNPR